jgi:hypothetical protein
MDPRDMKRQEAGGNWTARRFMICSLCVIYKDGRIHNKMAECVARTWTLEMVRGFWLWSLKE